MADIENPVALAGADRAGLRYAGELSCTRTAPHNQAQRRLRRQRQVERIHGFGARVFFELIDQLDREHDLGGDLDRQLERFAALDPEILRGVGGDRFAPMPVRLVGSAR